jgi:hypothetical protein
MGIWNPGYCFVPNGIALPGDYGFHCTPAHTILITLVVYGIISIAVNVILGFGPVKRKLSPWNKNKPLTDPLQITLKSHPREVFREARSETPTRVTVPVMPPHDLPSILPGLLTASLHIAFATSVTAVIIKGGFRVNFTDLFFLWLVRPRFGTLLTPFMVAISWKYTEALFDHCLGETLLEIISIGFAIKFIEEPKQQDPLCQDVTMTERQEYLWRYMIGAGRTLLAVGIIQTFSLALFLIGHFINVPVDGRTSRFTELPSDGRKNTIIAISIMWVVAVISFIASWVFWSSKC